MVHVSRLHWGKAVLAHTWPVAHRARVPTYLCWAKRILLQTTFLAHFPIMGYRPLSINYCVSLNLRLQAVVRCTIIWYCTEKEKKSLVKLGCIINCKKYPNRRNVKVWKNVQLRMEEICISFYLFIFFESISLDLLQVGWDGCDIKCRDNSCLCLMHWHSLSAFSPSLPRPQLLSKTIPPIPIITVPLMTHLSFLFFSLCFRIIRLKLMESSRDSGGSRGTVYILSPLEILTDLLTYWYFPVSLYDHPC